MNFLPESLAVYISIGLFSFLVLLWLISMCCCKGPCRDVKKPVKSTFEAHLDPSIRGFAIKKKYDLYYHRLLKGIRPPHPSAREQAMMDDTNIPYLVRTPLAGLTAEDLPLRISNCYEDDKSSGNSSLSDNSSLDIGPSSQELLEARPIPTIMVTAGSSTEIGSVTDLSRRSSEDQKEEHHESNRDIESPV